MTGSNGVLVAILLLGLATTGARLCGAQEQLSLTADVGKSEFFEDEPIYLLLRLQNVGTDTARTYFFSLLSPAVTVSVIGKHGTVPYRVNYVFDYHVPSSSRGEPLPPGASILKTMVLQSLMGDESDLRSHLYAHHLTPDDYELHVEFKAHFRLSGMSDLTVQAQPIVFRIRARTDVEEDEVKELEGLQRMGWDTTDVGGYSRAAGYHPSLMRMLAGRFRERPDDPFLPFLLTSGVYVVGKALEDQLVSGKVRRFDPDTSLLVSELRLAVIDRQRHSTGAALLVQRLSQRHSEQLTALAQRLRDTPAGEMAQYQMEHNLYVQQHKQPRPR